MSRFKLYFSIFFLCFNFCDTQISDKRLCVDAECSSPVSYAKTLTTYFAKDSYHLSFHPNEKVIIYSKPASSKEKLWGAEIRGKRGYIPSDLIRETKVLKKPLVLVDTEINTLSNVAQVPQRIVTVNPSKVKQSYEVIDGTTIYVQPDDNLMEETQVKAKESATEGSNISIGDSNIKKNIDNEVDNSINNEQSENDSDTGNLGDTNVQLEHIEFASKEKEKNVNIEDNKPTSNLEFADNKIDGDKLNQGVEKVKQSSEIYGMKNNEDDKELKVNDQIEETINRQSSGSDQSNSDETGNYSGIFGNVLDMMMEAIDGKDNIGDKEIVEEERINENILTNNEEGNTKPHVPIESNAGEVNKHENHSEEKVPDNSYIIHENIFEKKDESLKNKTKEASHSVDEQIEQLDVHASGGVNVSDNEVLEEKKPDLVDDLRIQHISDSHELFENQKISNKSDVYKQKVSSSDSLKNTTETFDNTEPFDDTATNKKISSDFAYNKFESGVEINATMDNPDLVDENIFSSEKSIVAPIDTENPNFVSISNHPQFENVSVDPSNSEAIIDNVHDSKYEESQQNMKQPEIFDDANNALERNDENTYNELDNPVVDTTEVVYRRNDVETDSSISSDNNDEQGVNLKDDGTENLDYISGNDEEGKQQENTEDIEKWKVSSDISSNLESINSEDNKKISSSSGEVLESTSGYKEIGSQEHKDQEDSLENENDKYSNVEVLQEVPHMFSYFGHSDTDQKDTTSSLEKINTENSEKANTNDVAEQENNLYGTLNALPILSSEFFLYLVTTAISVIIFLLGYFALDKSRREAPLVAKINKLEKEFLILLKEKELLAEEVESVQNSEHMHSPDFLNLQKQYEDAIKEKETLIVEIQTLEKELENSTEVGLELNRMLSDILSSENAGSILMSNIEKLQAQLVEQQGIVCNMKETLSLKETENHELNLELEIANKKVIELQGELDRLLLNVIKLEEEKDLQERNSESEIDKLKVEIDSLAKIVESTKKECTEEVDELKNKLHISERNLQIKIKEFDGIKTSMQEIQNLKNGNTLSSLLEVNSIKAELEQLKTECKSYCEKLRLEQENNAMLEKKAKLSEDEVDSITKRYDEVDQARLELQTKLQVLTTYFKDKEEQLQRELSKYESMWSTKQGEATSTSERIKYLQSEVQNYRTQNESLKQEIVSQEVELKSQISVLEKKVHENWVTARQAERRLEDLKQEAAHLRNRLTLRERALQEDKIHNRIQSPLDQKIDLPVSPMHLDSPSSPLLYDTRDHITKSPPIRGMPPPFLPPPPGNPFLPPPHLPFMPPPLPDMFPGDRRPPPLGRMSSPPLNSRYSPDRRPYSPYERRSPSPSYDDSEYGISPVQHRRYSPFNNRVDHRRMGRMNGRSGELSSGSGNSNESLNGLNHPNAKV